MFLVVIRNNELDLKIFYLHSIVSLVEFVIIRKTTEYFMRHLATGYWILRRSTNFS